MKIIGLTGGIASGKSTVTSIFYELGIPIIDADVIAHQLVVKNMPALEQIKKSFGSGIVDVNGNLDRKKIRSLVFNNLALKQKLESILHPLIYQEIKKQISLLADSHAPYCLIVIPLLTEKKALFGDLIQSIIVIDISEDLQIKRLLDREKHSTGLSSDLFKIIKTQASRQDRLQIADEIIHNSGDLIALKNSVNQLHNKLKAV